MTTKVAILTATTGAAVATDGTLDFPYAGANITVTQATKIAGSEVLSVSALQQTVDQAADTFTVAYDSDSATITYKGEPLLKQYLADLICFDQIIVELKTVDRLSRVDIAQILNYLKATGLKVGVLINFRSHGKLEWKRLVM